MRKLVVSEFVSLDGVMQAPGGPEEDPTGNFTYGGWTVNYWDDAMNEFMAASMGQPFDLLLGRKTYEIFAAHWPHVNAEERAARGGTEPDVDDEAAAALTVRTKYVASRTLKKVEWQNSILLDGDASESRNSKPKSGPDLLVNGSGDSSRRSCRTTSSMSTACSSSRCCSATGSACSPTGAAIRTLAP